MTGPLDITNIYGEVGRAAAARVLAGGNAAPTAGSDTDAELFKSLTSIAERTGKTLSQMLGDARGAAVIDALTSVDPRTVRTMDSAWSRYQRATSQLNELKASIAANRGGGATLSGGNAAPDSASAQTLTPQQQALIARLEQQRVAAADQMLRAAEADAARRLQSVMTAANQQFTQADEISSQRAVELASGDSRPASAAEAQAAAERLTVDMVVGVAQLDALRAHYERVADEQPGTSNAQQALSTYRAREQAVLATIAAYEDLTGNDAAEGTGDDVVHMRRAGDELDATGHSTIAKRISDAAQSVLNEMFAATDRMHRRMTDRRRKFETEMRRIDEKVSQRSREDAIRSERIRAANAAEHAAAIARYSQRSA